MNAKRGILVLVMGMTVAARCSTGGDLDGGTPEVHTRGDGTIRLDGEVRQYRVVPEQSHLYILVQRYDTTACSFFHHHAVASLATQFRFALDRDQAGQSTLTATVITAGLDPDRMEYRQAFPETLVGPHPTDDDRVKIRRSVLSEVDAEHFPVMEFSASALTTLDGAGSAPVAVSIKGASSTATMNATASWAGSTLTLSGQANLDGRPHHIPSEQNSFKDCIDPNMRLDFRLVLEPGASDGGPAIPDGGQGRDAAPVFVPDDAGCGQQGYMTSDSPSVREILLMRCGGCHTNPTRLGATAPLTRWEDFRMTSARSEGRPLFEEVRSWISQDGGPRTDSTRMPPPALHGLTPTEFARVMAWLDDGAHAYRCDGQGRPQIPDAGPRMVHTPQSCGSIGFDDVKRLFEFSMSPGDGRYSCQGCHFDGADPLLSLASYETGLQPTHHEFYKPALGWEAASLRVLDESMPPPLDPAITVSMEDKLLLAQWVSQGFPRDRCGVDGGAPDASADAGP